MGVSQSIRKDLIMGEGAEKTKRERRKEGQENRET
jgi:hypothetical protein